MEQRRLIRYPTYLLGQASNPFCQKEDPFDMLETVNTLHPGPSRQETVPLSWGSVSSSETETRTGDGKVWHVVGNVALCTSLTRFREEIL